MDWMKDRRTIANPSKFHTMLFSTDKADTVGIPIKIKDQEIVSESKVELLGITIDNGLSFEEHISNLCKKAALQLNALKRLAKFLNFSQRKVLAQSFVLSNFNYCPLIWHFCLANDLHKMEQIQERTLRFVHADYASSYATLLQESKSCTLELRRVRSICIEVYKVLNNISPPYMSQLFRTNKLRHLQKRPLNLFVPRVNQTTFGLKSVRYEGIILCNSLPEHIKTTENLENMGRTYM